ncbi:hypothetical protein ABPG72_010878 [Tetrahymena utriculariae]
MQMNKQNSSALSQRNPSRKNLQICQGMMSSRSTNQIHNNAANFSNNNNYSTNISSDINISYESTLNSKEKDNFYQLHKQYSTLSDITFKQDSIRNDSVVSLLQKASQSQANLLGEYKDNTQNHQNNQSQQKNQLKQNLHRRVQSTIQLGSNINGCSQFQSQQYLSNFQQEKASFIKQQKIAEKAIKEAKQLIKDKQLQVERLKKENQKLIQQVKIEQEQIDDLKKQLDCNEKQQIPTKQKQYSENLDKLTDQAMQNEYLQSEIYQKLKQINEQKQQMLEKIDQQSKQIQYDKIQNQKIKQYHIQIHQQYEKNYQMKQTEQQGSLKVLSQLKQQYNNLIIKQKN